jgi:hypothetical protein
MHEAQGLMSSTANPNQTLEISENICAGLPDSCKISRVKSLENSPLFSHKTTHSQKKKKIKNKTKLTLCELMNVFHISKNVIKILNITSKSFKSLNDILIFNVVYF